jgi:hypothetical protein
MALSNKIGLLLETWIGDVMPDMDESKEIGLIGCPIN